jgi:hypothetical protein
MAFQVDAFQPETRELLARMKNLDIRDQLSPLVILLEVSYSVQLARRTHLH